MEGKLVTHIATILSAMTILSCLFLKVPQILYIRERQSAQGMYVQAMMMEIVGFSIMTLYNITNEYNLMTYLEYPIILLQVYVLLFYVLKYKRQLHLPVVPLAVVTYVIVVSCFVAGLLPKELLSYLLPFCTPLSGSAKVTYIYGMVKAGEADSVSLTTWLISVLTNLARVFTVYVDSADTKLMGNFYLSTLLSLAVLATALYYQNRSKSSTPQPPLPPPPPHPSRPSRKFYRRSSRFN